MTRSLCGLLAVLSFTVGGMALAQTPAPGAAPAPSAAPARPATAVTKVDGTDNV